MPRCAEKQKKTAPVVRAVFMCASAGAEFGQAFG
jgi:hypothetical protein